MNDNWSTPKYAFEMIRQYIPKCIIWDGFYNDGSSGTYLTQMGYAVIHEDKDFFTYEPNQYDIHVSNIPYSCIKKVLIRMKELNKPFILIMPVWTITRKYFSEMFQGFS